MFHRYVQRLVFVALTLVAVGIAPKTTQAEPSYRIAIIPKVIGIEYYDAVKKGIDEAAGELSDLEIIWTGPTQNRVEQQVDIIESLIPSRPDLIAIAANDPLRIVPVLKKAHAAGIRVMSWDGDSYFREFFVNLVDYDEFGQGVAEAMVEQVGSSAEIAIVTTTFAAPNQVEWIRAIRRYFYTHYPEIRVLDIRPAYESRERAYRIGQAYLRDYPQLDGIIALGVPNLPGVVDAIRDAGLAGKIATVGNATPNLMRDYIKKGEVKKVFLWNAADHGYLTVYSAYQLLTRGIEAHSEFFAGRLGRVTTRRDHINAQVALPLMIFSKDNIDRYDY